MRAPWKAKSTPAYLEQERKEAKKPGARLQVNSGRTWSGLRDVIRQSVVGALLIDCKTGANGPLKSYRLTEDEWRDLRRDANRTPPGCYPVLRIDIGPYKLMVIEDEMWEETGRLLEWNTDGTTKR